MLFKLFQGKGAMRFLESRMCHFPYLEIGEGYLAAQIKPQYETNMQNIILQNKSCVIICTK